MSPHRPIRTTVAAALLLAAAIPASAHHSAAMFDMAKQVSVQGTVEKWVWANPHSWLYVRVEKTDGTQEIWGCEAGSTGMLARGGWNAGHEAGRQGHGQRRTRAHRQSHHPDE